MFASKVSTVYQLLSETLQQMCIQHYTGIYYIHDYPTTLHYTKSWVAFGFNMSISIVQFVAAMSIEGENVGISYMLETFSKSWFDTKNNIIILDQWHEVRMNHTQFMGVTFEPNHGGEDEGIVKYSFL